MLFYNICGFIVVKSREERSKPYFDFEETETVEEDWGEINLVQQSIEQRGIYIYFFF